MKENELGGLRLRGLLSFEKTSDIHQKSDIDDGSQEYTAIEKQEDIVKNMIEKDTYDIELYSIPDDKIKVIRMLRELFSLPLKDSKEAIDNLPNIIAHDVSAIRADIIKSKLNSIGVRVNLK